MNIKQTMKLSQIIDKIDLKITDPTADQEQLGADLIMQLVRNAYKAEVEIYSFIADLKKIPLADAENVDIMDFVKDLTEVNGLKSFFTSASKLNSPIS